ncbi:MAG: phosphoribosylaminoimidazolesuccinocarboxamide synthase [Candidatus Auribacterota bacterium]|nr:phosphoribosylaminoimidazolesuccinocarboxamide synthase [Candidatus Auribacterota bacterium]
MKAISNIKLGGIKKFKSGKVRDIYDLGNKLLLVTSDRISAFDCIMPNPIPDKGRLLTGISLFWFEHTSQIIKNHIITADIKSYPKELAQYANVLDGRSILIKKCSIIPIECVVRGYLAGSGLKEYRKSQSVCGIKLPAGLKSYSKLPEPIFTPATKAHTGHDENITVKKMESIIGNGYTDLLIEKSMELYEFANKYSLKKGLVLADTKFEFGILNNEVILCDEIFTPDSSRFWLLSDYKEGEEQQNFDKQFLRDYLETLDWDKTPPAPKLPEEIVTKTRAKYVEAFERLTGEKFV